MSLLLTDQQSMGDGTHEHLIESNTDTFMDFHFVLLSNPSAATYNIKVLASSDGQNFTDETINLYDAAITGNEENKSILMRDTHKLTKPYTSFKVQVELTGSNSDVDFRIYHLSHI